MDFSTVHWLAVLVAGLVGFPLGFTWYGPLFGKPWREASGVSVARARGSNPALIYPTVLLLNLMAATGLAILIGKGDMHYGVRIGLLVSVMFVAVAYGINYLFEFRPLRLWFINSAYMIALFCIMGAILGAWH
jgi:hypothetical protein